MGTSLSSIHIYSNQAPADCVFSFRSFSPNWQTCIDDFTGKAPDYPYRLAKFISTHINAPVLHFEVFDSDMIWFEFFLNGKAVSKYSDDELIANRRLYDIPAMIGYGDGQKKRLSSILACSDIDDKIKMLEEYLGVCLLYHPEVSDDPKTFHRDRGDVLFRQYQAAEKELTGKSAPVHLVPIAEYPGKLFWDFFGSNHSDAIVPHCFLYGYTTEHSLGLKPVRFTGTALEPINVSAFSEGRTIKSLEDPRFQIHYGTPCKVTFSDDCPPDYRGKTISLPNGFFPENFTKCNELLLQGNHRIFVMDPSLKIIAKIPIKGEIADMVDDYILTTTGDSFCGYCFEPKAKIRIYHFERKPKVVKP